MTTRIKFEHTWKANTGNYEMLDTVIGIETDVLEGETPKERIAKVKRLVQAELEDAVAEARQIVRQPE